MNNKIKIINKGLKIEGEEIEEDKVYQVKFIVL